MHKYKYTFLHTQIKMHNYFHRGFKKKLICIWIENLICSVFAHTFALNGFF